VVVLVAPKPVFFIIIIIFPVPVELPAFKTAEAAAGRNVSQ
jgi:hypothetical protein